MTGKRTSVKGQSQSQTNRGAKENIDCGAFWDEKRQQIVERLNPRFKEIYEGWGARFTRVNETKAQCFAIDRKERRASAVVFLDSGRYHDSGGGIDCDIFEAAERFGGAADNRAALDMLAEMAGVDLTPPWHTKKHRPSRKALPRLSRFSKAGSNGRADSQTGGVSSAEEKSASASLAQADHTAHHVLQSATDPHFWAKQYIQKTSVNGAPTIRVYRGAWYQWREGRYVQITKDEIVLLLTKFVRFWMNEMGFTKRDRSGEETQIPVTPEMIGAVRNALASEVLLDGEMEAPFFITKDGPYHKGNFIAAKDGIVDIDQLLAKGELYLLSHDPNWFSFTCLPYPVKEYRDCRKWKEFLNYNFRDKSGKIDHDKIGLLQEFAGYLLLPGNTDEQKFLVMIGEGSNGKSVVCTVLAEMLGEKNVSHVSLECFGDRFSLSSTIGKLANIASEIGEIDKVAEGRLKEFTDGSCMTFDRKGIAPLETRPTARLILSTNNMPRFSDRSKGLWRRMIVMPFLVEVPKEKRIRGMDKPSYWQDELIGIFFWAIEGLRRIMEDGFSESAECEKALEECKRDSNPARVFLEESCEEREGASIPTKYLYKCYRYWCEENGTHPLGERMFGKEVRRVFSRVDRKRGSTRANRDWLYSGIDYIRTEEETMREGWYQEEITG